MKADFNVMKDVAVHTRVSPADRYKSVQKFLTRIQECPKAMEILNDWGLQLAMEPEPIQVKNIFMLQAKYSTYYISNVTRSRNSKLQSSNHIVVVVDMWVFVVEKSGR